ncbi:two-component regulator propeller domain-containing protein [Mesoflavibacter zeaxanthinifaciens]|uniref:type IX secretion system anionic LPS delivery protein PorZ n=1 Tax=Mesoflavibacter zeaxanthinifaciens TaxID=393060 RepID=UPI000426D2B1|nr:two-component regulator propeller domain-containing protein [Mesoflavibacter zeaxanthinifaciens]
MRYIKPLIFIFLFFFIKKSYCQNFEDAWSEHYSYLEIKDVSPGLDKLYVAAENTIFTYDINTYQIEKLSTINGLSGETISAILYIEDQDLLLLGFENGLMQIYDQINRTFLTVVDILDKPTIPPNNKGINQFFRNQDLVYISTDYGISVYNINALEFGDTYYIGPNGSQLKVRQTTMFNNYIYAATEQRLYRASLDNPNLIDYQEWESLNNGNWLGVQNVEDRLYVANSNRRVYEVVNGNLIQKVAYPQDIVGFKSNDNRLSVTITKQSFVYSSNFDQLVNAATTTDFNPNFSTSISVSEELFVGTNRIENTGQPAFGILKTSFSDPENFEEIHPESPLRNRFFKLKYQEGQIWGIHGGYSISYNFNGGVRREGISHFINDEWRNITYDSLTQNVTNPWYLSYLTIDPFNSSNVYVSSYYSGIINIQNEEVVNVFNQSNSSLVPLFGSVYLILNSAFDDQGNFYVYNGRVNETLNKLSENGQWTSYNYQALIDPATSNLGFSSMVFDNNGTIFSGSSHYGVIACVPNSSNNPTIVNISEEEEGMPSPNIRTLALDRNGQLWIGMDKGIRVVYNTQSFLENPEVDNIVVLDNGEASELLFQQFVTDIEVDGSNNKWIATLDTGLYYFSSDGQQTIYHFTKDNSPLPSNDVLDVALDEENGIVYIATEKGLLSFKSEASKPKTTLEDAFVFPNPVRPTFDMVSEKIKIRDISENVNIKITDIEGNLVAEAESNTNGRFKGYNLEIDGGTALWNGKNLAGDVVASGVYLVMLNDLDTLETKVLKLMVVR